MKTRKFKDYARDVKLNRPFFRTIIKVLNVSIITPLKVTKIVINFSYEMASNELVVKAILFVSFKKKEVYRTFKNLNQIYLSLNRP